MTWTAEGHKTNTMVRTAQKISGAQSKDIMEICKALSYTKNGVPTKRGQKIAKLDIKQLLREGWLKELPDRYVMTEKARKRIKMLEKMYKEGTVV